MIIMETEVELYLHKAWLSLTLSPMMGGSPAERSKLALLLLLSISYERFLKKSRHFHVPVKNYAGFVKAIR